MAYNNRSANSNARYNGPAKIVKCSCGGDARLRSRKNYPFGKKSRPVVKRFYKCEECGKIF